MKINRVDIALALSAIVSIGFAAPLSAQTGSVPAGRVILGGKAVVMVADLVYAFHSAPERVLAVAGTDQGLGVFLKAVDPSFAAKPVLDRNAGAETYASLKPDLIILKNTMKPSLGSQLETLGLASQYVDLETPEDYYRDLAAVGRLFGEEARAEELITYYKDIVIDTMHRTFGAVKPRVLLVQASTLAGVWEAPPSAWIQTELVRMAGGEPIWTNAVPGSGWTRLNVEQIAAWNPEAVIVVSYREDSGKTAATFHADPAFAGIAAVTSNRILAMPQDFYSWDQPDTRWILGLRSIAAFLHSNRFADYAAEAESRRFFRVFYNMNDGAYDRVIKPMLKGGYGER